ncbi:MAG: hypothetical protein WCG07_02800 [Candidatus Taylorbacteria bacterium]
MKKNYTYLTIALALICALPAITRAQEDGRGQLPPPPQHGSDSGNFPGRIGEKFRQALGDRPQNNSGENRNGLLENTLRPPQPRDNEDQNINNRDDQDGPEGDASSTHPRFGRPDMRDGGPRGHIGSSTDERFGKDGERPEGRGFRNASNTDEFASSTDRGPRREQFEGRKHNIIQQMQRALNNLNQIRARINSRIQKEQSAGVDMTDALSKLAAADLKIATASSSIDALIAFDPSTSLTPQASSTSINLAPARSLAESAISTTHNARTALNEVVRSIAHSLGLDLGEDNRPEESSTTSASTQ